MSAEAPLHAWLPEPISDEMARAVMRLQRTPGVRHVALMPDAHLAEDVCVGTVVATEDRLIPDAVGGDIGCGMRAIGFDVDASSLQRPEIARAILLALTERVPIKKAKVAIESREAPSPDTLSAPALRRRAERDGRYQLGSLGRGNHFLELQRDDEDRLFAMVHTGSRGMGPLVREHHKREGIVEETGLVTLDAHDARGAAYLGDVAWCRAYARASRGAIFAILFEVLEDVLGAHPDFESEIEVDHNHVMLEAIDDHEAKCFVHRKGAMHAMRGALGVIPGSMGSHSYHVEGRGHGPALSSCSHGAGRAMSRTEARRRITESRFLGETRGVWFDSRLARRLTEEAPSAYKDVTKVMAAQHELTRIVRRLTPLLAYKGA